MAYDEDLADRIRELLGGDRDVTEKRMFGGLAFLIDGKMSVDREQEWRSARTRRPGADRPAPARARTSSRSRCAAVRWTAGSASTPAGVRTTRQLRTWVDRCIAYARSLPAKR